MPRGHLGMLSGIGGRSLKARIDPPAGLMDCGAAASTWTLAISEEEEEEDLFDMTLLLSP